MGLKNVMVIRTFKAVLRFTVRNKNLDTNRIYYVHIEKLYSDENNV